MMISIYRNFFPSLSLLVKPLLYLILTASPLFLQGQVNPPRPMSITVSTQQSLNFGSFAITGQNGGTVTVSNTGVRSFSGDIFLSGNSQTCGIFTIDVVSGTSLFMVNGLTATLTGSNGGELVMTLGQTYPALPYTTITSSTVFQIGGTLTVGQLQNNPPGYYYGTYSIIIVHE